MDPSGQRAYPRPPGAPFIVPGGMQMPPEMAQMPAMMMPQQFPAYGAVMMPGGGMMPMTIPMQPMGMAPQLSQMLAESARGGRGSNVFFKTRLCNRWRAGNCPFGDKCTYAHGQHELRYIPPELLAQLEREQRMQEHAQPGPQASPHPPGSGTPKAGTEDKAGASQEPGGADQRNKPQVYFKTRLCIRFMQTGYCARGAACTFAHGYEDLRLQGQGPQHVPQHAQQGYYPPPQHPYYQQYQQQHGDAGGRSGPRPRGGGGGGRSGSARHSDVVERARGVSALAGVGNAAEGVDASEVQEALEAVRSGEAFRGNAYADSAEDFITVAD